MQSLNVVDAICGILIDESFVQILANIILTIKFQNLIIII